MTYRFMAYVQASLSGDKRGVVRWGLASSPKDVGMVLLTGLFRVHCSNQSTSG